MVSFRNIDDLLKIWVILQQTFKTNWGKSHGLDGEQ